MTFKTLMPAIALVLAMGAGADEAWYWGHVQQVHAYSSDGSFIVYLDNPDIASGCEYGRVYFRVSDMGVDRTEAALSMALTALETGNQWGVVVELPMVPESTCYAFSPTPEGAGIRQSRTRQ